MKHYEKEFKMQIVRLHLGEGRSISSLEKEYSISKQSVLNWVRDYREECRNDEAKRQDLNLMEEMRKMKKELEEREKEILFLKKAAAFFAEDA